MRHLLFSTVILLIFSGACSTARKAGLQETDELARSLLWKIEDKTLGEPSYLLGTIHLIPDEMYFWTEEMEYAFQQSDQIAMELDMEDTNPAALMGLMGSLLLPDGKSIGDFVSAGQYEEIRAYFEKTGLPFMLLEKIKPYFLYLFISLDIDNLDQESIKSYEMEITEKARSEGKPAVGLESIEFQISLFDSIPYDYQADMLVQAIEQKQNPAGEMNESEALFQAYVDQDISLLYKESSEEGDEIMQKFSHLLIDKRNRSWIPVIAELVRQKPTLIAVGAGHLGGPNGVIRLLQNEGFTITPIMMQTDGTD